MPIEDFHALVERAMQQVQTPMMRPVVEKELLHYDILFALDAAQLLDTLVFQGGTALRLCYGAARLSEDLDFAGGVDFQASDLRSMKDCLEDYIGKRYGLDVYVKEPNVSNSQREAIHVEKWQVRIITAPKRPDLPKQMIKIEIATVPAYTAVAKPLQQNYNFLADGYTDTLVFVETLDEIMADKLVAYPSSQQVIRYRDLWDLQWMIKKGARLHAELVCKKLNDYRIDLSQYKKNLAWVITQLPSIIASDAFKGQMTRFIPHAMQAQTIQSKKFYAYLENELTTLFRQLQSLL